MEPIILGETPLLWSATHTALCGHEWSKARKLLDDLGRHNDNHHLLSSAKMYGCPKDIHDVIQDRIDLVNSYVR